jgi:hypothetical protein
VSEPVATHEHDDRPTGARRLVLFLVYGVLSVVVASPVLVQQTLAGVSFEDRLGTFPVEVSTVRNGYSVLDTGALGSVYLEQTGALGLGFALRVTGPPDAGGSLSSYVDPTFVRANTATLTHPERVRAAYTDRLGDAFVSGFWPRALVVLVLGGLLLLYRAHPALTRTRGRRRQVTAVAGTIGLLAVSSCVAVWQHRTWSGSERPDELYPLPQVAGLSFDSPETLEVARQVGPFVDKNVSRLRERAAEYERLATGSIRVGVPASAAALRPREGERIVVAEADPQGSEVGTEVRRALYDELVEVLGDGALLARTISGDVTANGAVAEQRFVEEEVSASGDLPVIAVKGDHDSETTMEQLVDAGAEVTDLDVLEVRGLQFTGVADPEFKSLFGGSVSNPSGVTPTERGVQLRTTVEDEVGESDETVRALVHQHRAALGYLGFDDREQLRALPGPEADAYTRPVDDGIPDVPAGSLVYGHWHENDGPWIIWNTDAAAEDATGTAGTPVSGAGTRADGGTEGVTWTLVDQVGTSGGVEERPTIDRFSTPYSPPLKPIQLRLHYTDTETGLVTGFVSLELTTFGDLRISRRTDVGVPISR